MALSDNWCIEISENGWMTDQIGLLRLQNHFIPATQSCTKRQYQLLILDGHSSHLFERRQTKCKDALDVADDSGKSRDPRNPELKDPTICTNRRNLSVQSLQLGPYVLHDSLPPVTNEKQKQKH